jgi:hypothetical protein
MRGLGETRLLGGGGRLGRRGHPSGKWRLRRKLRETHGRGRGPGGGWLAGRRRRRGRCRRAGCCRGRSGCSRRGGRGGPVRARERPRGVVAFAVALALGWHPVVLIRRHYLTPFLACRPNTDIYALLTDRTRTHKYYSADLCSAKGIPHVRADSRSALRRRGCACAHPARAAPHIGRNVHEPRRRERRVRLRKVARGMRSRDDGCMPARCW